ncbi:MAG: DUF61 family protein [Methanomicrobiaceae archaeon]|uniref:DUF61 family protein n=1 Tax=hydrocarbon metagenome TaxID=938273 RepID=A0A0W8FJR3_9ZZZZ|nr:DUF61 family protein [Methanomicrobiaceae archaeon]MDD5418926.1 DUF61 family protein [Methanomicrobiaceae archaeon]
MRDRPSISDEAVLMKWMRLEMGRINEGIVGERKTLAELLAAEKPSARTKGGSEYLFDREVLRELGERLPAKMHPRLRLPVLFYLDTAITDSVFLADAAAVSALQILGELGKLRRMEKGKLWVSRPIAYAILQKYPTAVQIVMR